MTTQEIEDLFIRSLDDSLSAREKEILADALKSNTGLAGRLSRYDSIREVALRKSPASFGPYFARKVVTRIQNVGIQIDRQILAYFKKYQLVAAGIVIALLAFNAVFADQVSIQSILGLEDTPQQTEEIVSFDFNDLLNN